MQLTPQLHKNFLQYHNVNTYFYLRLLIYLTERSIDVY